jgi:hypothetical protein
MPRGRYVDARNWVNDHQAAGRANAAVGNVDAGSAQLNNFNNTGAAQHFNQVLGQTQHDNAQWNLETSDERAMQQLGHEQSLQNEAMRIRGEDVAGRNAAEMAKAGAMGRVMGGGGLLSGLTTSAPQKTAVNLYGSSGRRIGGTPLAGLA